MGDEFMSSWMNKCNPDLILRFWRSKGSPGELTLVRYGIKITHIKTVFGELVYIKRSFKN